MAVDSISLNFSTLTPLLLIRKCLPMPFILFTNIFNRVSLFILHGRFGRFRKCIIPLVHWYTGTLHQSIVLLNWRVGDVYIFFFVRFFLFLYFDDEISKPLHNLSFLFFILRFCIIFDVVWSWYFCALIQNVVDVFAFASTYTLFYMSTSKFQTSFTGAYVFTISRLKWCLGGATFD